MSTTASDLSTAKVEASTIERLMDSLEFHVSHYKTTTLALAVLPSGFSVAVGLSACVSPANFSAQLGLEYAIKDAKEKARAELWKLEGYALAKQLGNPGANLLKPTTWQERLFAEYVETAERLDRLANHLQKNDLDVNEVDLDLLKTQAAAMSTYLSVLRIRCKRAGFITKT